MNTTSTVQIESIDLFIGKCYKTKPVCYMLLYSKYEYMYRNGSLRKRCNNNNFIEKLLIVLSA